MMAAIAQGPGDARPPPALRARRGPDPGARGSLPFVFANEQGDLRITIDGWRRGGGGSSLFDLTIEHTGAAAAYRDLRYVTEYRAASGELVRPGEGKVYEVIQPGQTLRLVAFNEGGVDARAARAAFRVVGAEKLVPTPPAAQRWAAGMKIPWKSAPCWSPSFTTLKTFRPGTSTTVTPGVSPTVACGMVGAGFGPRSVR